MELHVLFFSAAREKAMVVNLEFIKAIVTAEEVLLLDPLRQEVLPFVEQLRQQLPHKSQPTLLGPAGEQESEMQASTGRQWLPVPESAEGLQSELPFEFQVLEIALEVVCTSLDSSVADLERGAYPVLDELARNVSTKNLEHVRSLKSNLTRLLARVQKVCCMSTIFFFLWLLLLLCLCFFFFFICCRNSPFANLHIFQCCWNSPGIVVFLPIDGCGS